MTLLVLGINHKTATIDVREKVVFSNDQGQVAIDHLLQLQLVQSVVILSTCNRTELYCEISSQADAPLLLEWLADFHQLSHSQLSGFVYFYFEEQAVRHLMQVVCGLDSLVLGEPQIFGQVKQAYSQSLAKKAVSGALDRLFQKSFSVAKQVRTQTAIGANAVSVAYAACMLARTQFTSLHNATVLLVGAGATTELVAKHLCQQHCKQLIVASRSKERAQHFATQFNAQLIMLEEIPSFLAQTDLVISSTASPLPLIGKGMVEQALKAKRAHPLLLIDIAIPRDIEPQIKELDGVLLYALDDLHHIVEHNIEQRKAGAQLAKVMIDKACDNFMRWLCSQDATVSIKQYRAQSEQIKNVLLNKGLTAIAHGKSADTVLIELCHKLTNKLLHSPTQALQVAAQQSDDRLLALLRESLDLEKTKN
ncbi:MAG: glutamyl-tRNA reductase [Enterovibrio sp.]